MLACLCFCEIATVSGSSYYFAMGLLSVSSVCLLEVKNYFFICKKKMSQGAGNVKLAMFFFLFTSQTTHTAQLQAALDTASLTAVLKKNHTPSQQKLLRSKKKKLKIKMKYTLTIYTHRYKNKTHRLITTRRDETIAAPPPCPDVGKCFQTASVLEAASSSVKTSSRWGTEEVAQKIKRNTVVMNVNTFRAPIQLILFSSFKVFDELQELHTESFHH